MAGINFFQVARNKSKRLNVFDRHKNFNKDNENISKSDRLMNGIALWGSFYRANPHRFVEEYLFIQLKLFQKILIYMMMHCYYFIYLASRGQGR
jgi:hypothetical protein